MAGRIKSPERCGKDARHTPRKVPLANPAISGVVPRKGAPGADIRDPMSAQSDQTLGELGQASTKLAQIGPDLVQIGPNLARLLPNVARLGHTLWPGRIQSTSTKLRPLLAQFGQAWPNLVQLDRSSTKFGQCLTTFGRHSVKSRLPGQLFDNFGDNSRDRRVRRG